MPNSATFKDFYQVPDLAFDISKLRSDLDEILKNSKYQTLGITNFAAIPMNQIPGDESSIQGHNVRGIYGRCNYFCSKERFWGKRYE